MRLNIEVLRRTPKFTPDVRVTYSQIGDVPEMGPRYLCRRKAEWLANFQHTDNTVDLAMESY